MNVKSKKGIDPKGGSVFGRAGGQAVSVGRGLSETQSKQTPKLIAQLGLPRYPSISIIYLQSTERFCDIIAGWAVNGNPRSDQKPVPHIKNVTIRSRNIEIMSLSALRGHIPALDPLFSILGGTHLVLPVA